MDITARDVLDTFENIVEQDHPGVDLVAEFSDRLQIVRALGEGIIYSESIVDQRRLAVGLVDAALALGAWTIGVGAFNNLVRRAIPDLMDAFSRDLAGGGIEAQVTFMRTTWWSVVEVQHSYTRGEASSLFAAEVADLAAHAAIFTTINDKILEGEKNK